MNPVDFKTKIQEDVRDIICEVNEYLKSTKQDFKTTGFTIFGEPSDSMKYINRLNIINKLGKLEELVQEVDFESWRPS
jgi:hypothetical protein